MLRSLGAEEQLDVDVRHNFVGAVSGTLSRVLGNACTHRRAAAGIEGCLAARPARAPGAPRLARLRVRVLVAKVHNVADVPDGLKRHVIGLEARRSTLRPLLLLLSGRLGLYCCALVTQFS